MSFEQLDVFIAFAVVMLLLSAMVMAFVQLVVAVLGIRGRNLRWGVRRLLQEAAPEVFDGEDGAQDATEIAHRLLTHPALGPTRNWVAMALRWVVDKTRALPVLKEPAAGKGRLRRPVHRVLEAVDVFRNGRRPVCTVRAPEVVKLLERVQREAESGSRVAQRLAAALSSDADEFVREGSQLAEGLAARFPDQAEALRKEVEAIGRKGGELGSRVQDWFETVMDATTERFKLWCRWITAVGAVLLAFGFQVDSISIFKQLSGDPKLRQAIVEQAAAAENLFETLQQAAAEEEGEAAGGAAAGGAPAAAGPSAAGGEAGSAAGASAPPQDARARVEAARKGLEKSRQLVAATGLDLLEPLYPSFDALWADGRRLFTPGTSAMLPAKLGQDLAGKLMTVLLLSLGAPFWYNALSKAAGLRSVVAKKLDRPERGAGAVGD